ARRISGGQECAGRNRQFFFFQAEDGIRDRNVTGVQTCALPICRIAATEEMVLAWVRSDAWSIEESSAAGTPLPATSAIASRNARSEERRVGKECRSGWSGEE